MKLAYLIKRPTPRGYSEGQLLLIEHPRAQEMENWLNEYCERVPWLDESYLLDSNAPEELDEI